jgi:hypothetical protein
VMAARPDLAGGDLQGRKPGAEACAYRSKGHINSPQLARGMWDIARCAYVRIVRDRGAHPSAKEQPIMNLPAHVPMDA